MYQQIMLIGHLGNDPVLRYTPTGVPVTSFSLAVNRTWTGQDGNKQDKTTWFNVTSWRKQAEIVNQYLHKGAKVMVVGEVEEARPYVDRDGNQRASLEVTASVVKFLSGTGDGDGATGPGATPKRTAAPPSGSAHQEPELRDEDIPF